MYIYSFKRCDDACWAIHRSKHLYTTRTLFTLQFARTTAFEALALARSVTSGANSQLEVLPQWRKGERGQGKKGRIVARSRPRYPVNGSEGKRGEIHTCNVPEAHLNRGPRGYLLFPTSNCTDHYVFSFVLFLLSPYFIARLHVAIENVRYSGDGPALSFREKKKETQTEWITPSDDCA